MKILAVALATSLALSTLPTAAQEATPAEVQALPVPDVATPSFGVELQGIREKGTKNLYGDLQMTNFTGQRIRHDKFDPVQDFSWASCASPVVNNPSWPWYPADILRSDLDDKNVGVLGICQVNGFTGTTNPYVDLFYTIEDASGSYPMKITFAPYAKNKVISGLMLGYHVLSAAVGAALMGVSGPGPIRMALFDYHCMTAALEGNELIEGNKKKDIVWLAVYHPLDKLSTKRDNLRYKVIASTENNRDYLAIDIAGRYVAQLLAVNVKSEDTGNTMFQVSFFKKSDWEACLSGGEACKQVAPPEVTTLPAVLSPGLPESAR